MPLARALFLNEATDPAVFDHLNDQFFVGRDFLVAPILFPAPPGQSAATRSVYLPTGSNWYSFKDNTAPLDAAVPGGTTITNYVAGLDLVPIYVRAGTILPMRSQVEQYVGERASNPLDINVYPGPDSTYVMYQDDGITSNAAANGHFRTTEISHQRVNGITNVRLRRLKDAYKPPEPFYTVTLPGTQQPARVTAGGAAVPDVGSAAALASSSANGFRWDGGLQTTIVKVFDTTPDVTISVAD